MLKPFKGDHSNPYVPLSLITSEDGPVLQPIAILHSRVILRGGEHISQVFVKWEGLKDYEATWEDLVVMQQNYPNLNLEDKVLWKEGGNETNLVMSNANKERELDNLETWQSSKNDDQQKNKQLAQDPRHMGVCKSGRKKITNSLLQDFVAP